MKYLLLIVFVFGLTAVSAQNTPENKEEIRKQMARIRQTTNWDDPVAARKANEEIQRLAKVLSGARPAPVTPENSPVAEIKVQTVSGQDVQEIASRFFIRSYKKLPPEAKIRFDNDVKQAEKSGFATKEIRRFANMGGEAVTFGADHHVACVYLASAVKNCITDTAAINNFGAYLRIIDSVKVAVPVLLYANQLCKESPLILTQLGHSFFELNDLKKAEQYYREALKVSPDFGLAHTALCDLYLVQKRWKEALQELFAGVRHMGCSYSRASQNFAAIHDQYPDNQGKDAFWDETRKQIPPEEALAPLVPPDDKVKIPVFPTCNKVEDWLEGGGLQGAGDAYTAFANYSYSFASEFQDVNRQLPQLAPGAVLIDYPNERFALDCIIKMCLKEAKNDEDMYHQARDKIIDDVNKAKEEYIEKLLRITEKFKQCGDACGSNAQCIEECQRKYCSEDCPNAIRFNGELNRLYGNWTDEFRRYTEKQRKNLDDLYGFCNPWLAKIKSPYWSNLYAYELKRAAMVIAGSAYVAYAQHFQALSRSICGTDCSVYANPYPVKVEEVSKAKPKGNECDGTKHVLPLLFCEVSLTCETIEFGCALGAAASVQRNFGKNKSTTIFVGTGVNAKTAVMSAGAKFGGQITFGDDGSVDGGFKGSVSSDMRVPSPLMPGRVTGQEAEYTLTVMGGLNTSVTKTANIIP